MILKNFLRFGVIAVKKFVFRDVFALGLFATIIAGACFSCKNNSNPVRNLNDIIFPDTGISYERQVQPLFNIGCAINGCHDATTMAKNLDLSSYGAWINDYGVIIPKDTTNSRLVWSIEGKNNAVPMPPYKALSLNQVNGLKRWIFEGAKDTQ
ncbi:MAG: hypothetical protein KGJ59_10485 [Bacteroidota bacterium]|nr:hypothetical protein [Bacteroidota bacterium]